MGQEQCQADPAAGAGDGAGDPVGGHGLGRQGRALGQICEIEPLAVDHQRVAGAGDGQGRIHADWGERNMHQNHLPIAVQLIRP